MWSKKSKASKSPDQRADDAHFKLMSGDADTAFDARCQGYKAKQKAWSDWTSGKTDRKPWDC